MDNKVAEEKIERLENIIRSLSSAPFICGKAGTETNGLPEFLFVCPQYGLSGYAVYKKEKDYSEPEY